MYDGFRNPTPEHPLPCGRYELLERIGYGGMAEIFRARLSGPSGFEKVVVIKRILPRLAHDNLMVRMFIEEAKIAAAADHDNIATVFELGVADDGKFFIVMEYIRGIDLELLLGAAVKRSLRIPPWFALHAVSEILEGLSYLHDLADDDGQPRNVIHRDATPSNIFVSNLGQVKLSDFGVAHFEGKSPTTQAGQLKGKLAYMSPEQLNNKVLDGRADLFTIGVVLWEAITHQRLYGALSDVQAMMAICDSPRRPPSEHARDIPAELDAMVLRALSIDRDERYATAAEFQKDVLDVMHAMRGPVRRSEVRNIVRTLTGRDAPTDETSGSMLALSGRAQASFLMPLDDLLEETDDDVLDAPTTSASDDEAVLQTLDEMQEPPRVDEVAALRAMAAAPSEYDDPMDQTLRDDGMPSIAMAAQPSVIVAPTHRPSAPSIPDPAETTPGYTGPYPFYVRRKGQASSRAMALSAANQALAVWAEDGKPGAISTDDRYWIDAAEYAELTSQDLIAEAEAPPTNITVVGSAAQRRIPAVLSVLARDRATGALSVARTGAESEEWYDIRLVDGRPTRLKTNVEAMQLPNVLASHGWVPAEEIPSLIHAVVRERRPIEHIARERGHDTPSLRDIARARAAALFSWSEADYTFNADVDPARPTSFAGSVLALLPALIQYSLSSGQVLERIVSRVDTVHEPSWRFDEALDEMELAADARATAELFRTKTTVRAILEPRMEARDRVLAMALLLTEADLWLEVE